MNHFIKIIILAVFTATACSRDIISSDDLPEIIAEMYITDQKALRSNEIMTKADSLMVYEPLFNKYGYTTEDFRRTIDYYLPRPMKLKSFFIKAKRILEKRERDLSSSTLAGFGNNHRFPKIVSLIENADSLKEMDSYQRSLRWILAPEKLPSWRIYFPDSLAVRYEIPKTFQWWSNNMTTPSKSFLKYEKNSGTISLPLELPADPERLPMPPH